MKKQPLFIAILLIWASGVAAADPRADFFEKRIRPLLVEHCYQCHGADEAEGDLRLDVKAGWVRGGKTGPAIVPGDPSSSLLMGAVTFTDKKLKMPPPGEGERLTAPQIEALASWIRQGAFDPRTGETVTTSIEEAGKTHWAFQPIASPPMDTMAVGEHPIDYLVDRRLSWAGFRHAAPADTRTLLRRATYGLHGLPPTDEQLLTRRADFSKLVDKLLASPRYGERWGRHWLDVARYSDAKDGVLMYGDKRIRPFAYTYRDYVIRAFNEDKPFDQFIREQLAADQLGLPERSPNLAAMGLLTLGRMFDRNPHDVIDDQIDVVTRGFLGLTVSCARCHDHKFDPVPTADYYSLYGVMASSFEPYERPRIEEVTESGRAFEEEFQRKLEEVFRQRGRHYERTLKTARERTADYLVQVATTEPDISETSIFFLSLLPEQLRPQITYRWRKLIARRGYPDDPVFGPWHDLMKEPKLRVEQWRQRGVDERVISALADARPQTREQIAQVYGEVIRGVWAREGDLGAQIAKLQSEIEAAARGDILLADVVGGGNGLGTGKRGAGIHPATGKPTDGETGFVPIPRHDTLIPVPANPYIDGVFTPRSDIATVSTTNLQIRGLSPSSGKSWDYLKFGPSENSAVKSTVTTIDGVDFGKPPHTLLWMHANKGVTFDIQALRDHHGFTTARFKTLFGHGGAEDKSQLNFAVFVDGRRAVEVADFPARGKGRPVDVALGKSARFLTLVVTEGRLGIVHDQAMLGDPRIIPDDTPERRRERETSIQTLKQRQSELRKQLESLAPRGADQIADLLLSKESPVWFPIQKIYYYLSRKDKDAFRGLVNQLDEIAVKHKGAAGRAMVMRDSESLYDPVVFQRGDPTMPGAGVPRQFLNVASAGGRQPFKNGAGRLELANAIASPDNPLTARVWVNRVWMHHFGEPLVADPSDFGLRTPRPVQHELLDYLAVQLIRYGWRTKPLHRLIMTSRTYQRSSLLPKTPLMRKQLERDPLNHYLWRATRRRLDLEQMRDTLLVLSGDCDFTMFGRPPAITDLTNRRRTVYAFVERQSLPDVVQTFDFANADTSTARRVTTTVPQQALFAMNSPFVLQTAKALAGRAAESTDDQRLRRLYQLALGRAPTDEEVALGLEFVQSNPWEQFAQILLMTNELMFVD